MIHEDELQSSPYDSNGKVRALREIRRGTREIETGQFLPKSEKLVIKRSDKQY